MKISEQCLERFNKNRTDFVSRFITMDETSIHHHTPGFKQQSKQWTEACSAPKKTSSVPLAGKVMVSLLWDAEGILFIDYLEKGETITREYYPNLLTKIDKTICKKKKHSLQKGKKKLSFRKCS
jgi:hypothetical protein